MIRFRRLKSHQRFAAVHANVYNHFNFDFHLTDCQAYEVNRSAALAEWQGLLA